MVKGKGRIGRKKIEIKRMEKKDARDVFFSKRRQGLFNKAGEISLLCNANIATVVFSRAGKGFSFAHPSVDAIADRLASMAMGTPNIPSLGGVSHDSGKMTDKVQQMNLQYVQLQKSVETEEKRKKTVQEAMEKEMGGYLMQWLNSQVKVLGLDELVELHNKISALPDTINAKLYQILHDARKTRMPLPQRHVEMAWPYNSSLKGKLSHPRMLIFLNPATCFLVSRVVVALGTTSMDNLEGDSYG